MSVTKQQVLDGLAKVASPRGVPLTNANVLSEIAVNDGKVFFSINVDATEARAWEGVRAQAEALAGHLAHPVVDVGRQPRQQRHTLQGLVGRRQIVMSGRDAIEPDIAGEAGQLGRLAKPAHRIVRARVLGHQEHAEFHVISL